MVVSVSAMDRKLLTFLENLKYEVKGNTQLLNILIKQNNKQNECMTTDIPEGLTVTIGNVQDFETMDEKLQNETLAQKLVGGPPFDTGIRLGLVDIFLTGLFIFTICWYLVGR